MRTQLILPAALAGLFLVGGPSMARPSRPGPPPVRYQAAYSGEGFLEADIALRNLNLSRKQRDKIHNVLDKYTRRIDDARRDRNLAPSKREDRIWAAHRSLRQDVMNTLTREQRERVESIARRESRGGRGPGWMDRPGNGPRWRR